MSKESKLPLMQTIPDDKGAEHVVPLRWRRYPVDRNTANLIGADEATGHRLPPPSSRRKRR